jgi:hypothetical protein
VWCKHLSLDIYLSRAVRGSRIYQSYFPLFNLESVVAGNP